MTEQSAESTRRPNPRRGARVRAGLVIVCVLTVVALGVATPVAAASHQERACPGQNPNVGYEKATDRGVTHSDAGIAAASDAIGCPGGSNSGTTE